MNKIVFGTWAEIPSPYVTHIMAKAGLDFSIIDMEHGIIDFEQAQSMVFAAHSLGKKAYVRVPSIEESWTLRMLDTGCDGIVFPQVSSTDDIKEIIKISKFPPVGNRGFNPFISAGGYSSVPEDYFDAENNRIETAIILEGREVFEKIDDILSFDEIDIIYIGQYDLSAALGVPGQIEHPDVLAMMDRTVKAVRSHGKKAGCMVHNADDANKYISQGFNFVVYKVDTNIISTAIASFLKETEI